MSWKGRLYLNECLVKVPKFLNDLTVRHLGFAICTFGKAGWCGRDYCCEVQ